jgi:hypothetical protein
MFVIDVQKTQLPLSQSAPQFTWTVTLCPVLSVTTHCTVALQEPPEYLLNVLITEHEGQLPALIAHPDGLLTKDQL